MSKENKKPKFTKEQEERREVVHEATLDYCKVLTEDKDLYLNRYAISDIAEFASERVALEDHKVHYPAIVYLGDEKQIKDYIEKGDVTTVRKMLIEQENWDISDSDAIDMIESEEILDQNGEVVATIER